MSANSTQKPERSRLAWAFYDWANSAFATTVIAGFFPLFFKQYWSQGTSVTESTFYLGLANSAASLIIVLIAPVLGALADAGGLHKRLLLAFATGGMLATAGLYFIGEGQWPLAVIVYMFGIIGFSGANVFYDAMLPLLAPLKDRHRLSALGFSLGYLGGGLLFLINVAMTLKPGWFGLADAAMAVRWSFMTVAVWWAIFTLPLLLRVAESKRIGTTRVSISGAFKKVITTAKNIRQYRNLSIFLLAYWLYIDGVATIIRMAVDYGLAIGLPANSLIIALLIVQFIGFPATLLFGYLADRIGAKKGLWIGLWVYVLATIAAAFMSSPVPFYGLACALGLVQGGVQSLSRSLFSQLIPEERGGEFFGFLNMLGKAAAVVGPVLVGLVSYATDSPRLGIVSIILLFLSGMWFLKHVEEAAPQ